MVGTGAFAGLARPATCAAATGCAGIIPADGVTLAAGSVGVLACVAFGSGEGVCACLRALRSLMLSIRVDIVVIVFQIKIDLPVRTLALPLPHSVHADC